MLISDQDPPKTESTGLKNGRKCLKLINYIKKKKKKKEWKDLCGGGIRGEGLGLRWWSINQGHDRADLRWGLGL